ncbi:MAG: PQQ-binding-like beta-propeller repeat protein [Bryobacteraceae bacterium]|nr:PQQ-binding-like beta-propeller repeat protein [Bryobacteraceae bacterium]
MRLFLFLFCSASLFGEVKGDWPRWRGPFDNGVARGDAPLTWSDTENISWKIKVPGKGNSSPVIWEDKIFVTSAVRLGAAPAAAAPPRRGFGQGESGEQPEHQLTLLCYDRNSGKLLWERVAKTVKPSEGYHQRYGSFASNSPVTDGKRVYAFFGSNGAYAYDLNGKQLWSWESGVKMRMRNAFGEGVAPTLHEDTLLLLFDHEGDDDFLQALDAVTGKPKWRTKRSEVSNWAAPLVIERAGSKQVIVSAPTKVLAYDIKDGSAIWEVSGLGLNTIPAPVHSDGTLIVMSGFREPNLLAIKLGRKGDLTGTDSIVWTTTRGTSYTPSPVLHEGKLYMLTDSGMLSCLDAVTGKPWYERTRLPKPYNFKSSPVLVKDRLYLSSEDSDVIVVKAGEQFEVLATNTLADQSFIATPAVSGGSLYLRSETHLFCIRDSAAKVNSRRTN